MKHDYIGGGRPDNTLSNIDKELFESHVKKVREAGIRFNYLLNGSCLSNNEQDPVWQSEFKRFLEYLKDIGVNALTITNPYILMFVKNILKKILKLEFPHLLVLTLTQKQNTGKILVQITYV